MPFGFTSVPAGLVPVIHDFGKQRRGRPAIYFLFFRCSAMIGLAMRKQSTPIGAPQ